MKLNMKTLCSIGALLLCSESVLAMDFNPLEGNNKRTSQSELKSISFKGEELKGCSISYLEELAPQLDKLSVKGKIDDQHSMHNLLTLLKKAENLNILTLNNVGFEKVPSEVYVLKQLKYLDLGQNRIKNISPEIGELGSLECLYLDENQIESIPTEIGNLINLERLILRKNQIKSIPPKIGNLINLRDLDLLENQIKSIPPEIGNLINLEDLNLRRNKIGDISPEIGKLENLQKLDLSANERMNLPSEIENLKKLRTLDLGDNVKLTESFQDPSILDIISDLPNLSYLNINNYFMFMLDTNFIHLVNSPFSVNNLLKQNKKEKKRFVYTEKLDLSEKDLTRIPADIINLKVTELNLSNNKITKLPISLKNMEKLEEINLFGNPYFDSFKKIPGELLEKDNLNFTLSVNGESIQKSAKEIKEERILKNKEELAKLQREKAIESATQMFEEAEKEAAKAEAERQRIAQEKAEREAAQAASQVISRESYYSKFGQFFKSMWSRFTDSRWGRFLKNIGQTLFSNR
ncbi:MAG: leucine-rich repeat domain-containing protein [Alphaproteobacteria bacterium]|nr:leucine-rich repeat domain-containing protein [Alphaproteobacteria bacterium]